MKKTLRILFVILLLFLLTTAGSTPSTMSAAPLSLYQQAINTVNNQPDLTGPLKDEDFYFYKLKLFLPIPDKIENIFGKPVKYEENLFHVTEQNVVHERIYTYPCFQIRTLFAGAFVTTETVYAIHITGKELITRRGIRVGDPIKKIHEKYGSGGYNDYVYYKDPVASNWTLIPMEYRLEFYIKNGKVESIYIYTFDIEAGHPVEPDSL